MSATWVRPEEVFSFRELAAATSRAARSKRDRPTVARFLVELEPALCTLRDALVAGTWRPSPPSLITVHDPKPRMISVLPFCDRVVHQALFALLAPRVERRLIGDTFACRDGSGTHAAMVRARGWARTYRWFVHLDVARFFPSIDRAIVEEHVARDNPEPWVRALCGRILGAGVGTPQRWHFPGDDLFTPLARPVGLPLGNLTSQPWANRYLDPIDHLVKDRLRVRPYLRYMDDLLLFHDDRAALVALARAIEGACHELRLRLHPQDVMPTRNGVGFVGYRVHPRHVRVRRASVARAERRLRGLLVELDAGRVDPSAVWESLRATFSHWSWADSWRLRERLLRRLSLLYLPSEAVDERSPEL